MDRLIQRNADVYNLPEEEAGLIMSNLVVDLIKKLDSVRPDAFTTVNDVSIGVLEDLIKKGKMFNHKADNIFPGKPNQCFDNCMKISNRRLKMYMGYALSDNEQVALANGYDEVPEYLKCVGWLIHCWLVDKKTGKITETSPVTGMIAYFGFQVNVDYIHNWVRSLEQYPLTPSPQHVPELGFFNSLLLKNSEVLANA